MYIYNINLLSICATHIYNMFNERELYKNECLFYRYFTFVQFHLLQIKMYFKNKATVFELQLSSKSQWLNN